MKKVLCIAIATVMAVSLAHAEETSDEPGNLGVGYQGLAFDGGEYIMNQISVRYAPQPIGGALVFGHMKRDGKDGNSDYEYLLLQAKGFYTLIDRPNSDFYVGGSLGWGQYDYQSGSGLNTDEEDTLLIGALAGVEWNFAELPEIGFNFEIGYTAAMENDDDDGDNIFKGTSVSLGAHYYF